MIYASAAPNLLMITGPAPDMDLFGWVWGPDPSISAKHRADVEGLLFFSRADEALGRVDELAGRGVMVSPKGIHFTARPDRRPGEEGGACST